MAAHQLIPVFPAPSTAQADQQLCNARDLHAFLQVRRDFSNWIKRRIDEYGFVSGADFWVVDSPNLANQPKLGNGGFSPNLAKTKRSAKGGRPTIDYHLTLDMAKELAMIENNDIGRQVRRYFIRVEEEFRAELRDQAAHVLPVRGVKLMRDGLSMKDTLRLQEQSQKVMRMIMSAPTQAERRNLHLHFRQINLVLGVPTLDLDEIEAEIGGLLTHREG